METEREFVGFVRAHTPALLRTAYLLTGDGPAAEELVQETLVRLYPQWQRVADTDVPLAYVRRCVTHRFLNERRRPAARREVSVDALPDRGAVEDTAARFADRDELCGLLRTLPDRQRAALVLRYFHDLPDPEIAAALGCRTGTVRSLISRGLGVLREAQGPRPVPGPARRI